MSDFSAVEFKHIELAAGRKENPGESRIRTVKVIFIILCFLLGIEGVTYKLVLPVLRYPKVTFSGVHICSVQELQSKLLAMHEKSWLRFDTVQAVAILSSVPGIESVSIVKRFPDTVSVAITERQPVAMTFLTEGNRSVPVQIDKNGVLFSTNNGKPVSDGSVPIVSGLPVEHLSDGMRIPVKYHNLIDQIARIRSLPQKYFAAISEICVVPKEYGNYELMLFPAGSHTKVLTDRSLTEEALQYMMVVLDVVKSIDPGVSEVDLRYGSVSYHAGADWRKP
jgi:cell division protein FtsQ